MAQNKTDLVHLIKFGFDFLEGIFHDITNGITITDENSTILYVNPAFSRITGYSQQEAIGKNPGVLHSGIHDKAYYENMWKAIKTMGYWSGDIWNRHKKGHIIPEFLTITRLSSDGIIYYIAVFSDISTLVEKNKQKLNLAYSDPLTKLYNRNYLSETFKQLVNQFQRDQQDNSISPYEMAMLFIDVNKFKQINDAHGHLAGDKVLTHIANALKKALRKTDLATRYGGDEFVLLLTHIKNQQDIKDIAMRIKENLSQPLVYEDKSFSPKVSIGVATYPTQASSLETLVKKSDEAMYYAKINGHYLIYYNQLV